MSFISWLMEDNRNQSSRPSPKFVPKIIISPTSSLYVEVEPKDPTNSSNIVITAFASAQVRQIVPIRVEWSRFKVRVDNTPHSVEKIHCLVGNTYMCEPGDVGAYIKAAVRSAEEGINRAQAQVTIGPIGIDVMMKRLIEGALYSGSLLSQVTVCEKDRKNNVSFRLNTLTMEFTDENTGEKLVKDYSLSEPKIQLNPKDSTRVYLRFEQDQVDSVREWLNTIYNVRNASLDMSSPSIKVPYGHSASSSKLRLFQKAEHTQCINKIELRFISRNSRDLFLFTQRAFICREDMKNSLYLQRIQTLHTIATEDDYFHFLSYISLKNEIIRLAQLAQQLEEDRNQKVKDIADMEESIGDMTLTYLKIIEEKGKEQQVDFEASYSQISMTRQEILNRKEFRKMKQENESLKQMLRKMNEQLEMLKFLRKEDNQSMILNQTSNPFAKKSQLSVNYQGQSPEDNRRQRNKMHEMSMNYSRLLEQNNELKRQAMGKKKPGKNVYEEGDKSKNMIQLLGDLQAKEEHEMAHMAYQKQIAALTAENNDLKRRVDELMTTKRGLNVTSNRGNLSVNSINEKSIIDQSLLNRSNNTSVAESSINYSISSEAAVAKLEETLASLSKLNEQLQADVTRLRRQRDYYRSEASKLNKNLQQKQLATTPSNKHQEPSLVGNPNDNSVLFRYQQENQALQNQKKALLKKLESLSKENAYGIRDEFLQKQKKLKQYEQLIDKLKLQNIALSKQNDRAEGNKDQVEFFTNENIKLKKINSELLEQIKSLKIELQIRGQNLYNSRVIEMENELKALKGQDAGNDYNKDNRVMMDQINDLTKANARLKQENADKQTKLDHQTITIEKLMRQSSKVGNETQIPRKDLHNSSTSSTKERAYSQKCSQATIDQLNKYKRQVKKLQDELVSIRKSTDAINRSRDLTLQMDGYYEEKMDVMKKQNDALVKEIENLSNMCEKYGKDAREANKKVKEWQQKFMELSKKKDEDSLLL